MHGRVDTSRLENRNPDQVERSQGMTKIANMTPPIPRGKIIGKQTGGPPLNEAERFCCGGYFDMRDLGAVFDHEGPLPHPVEDRQQ